MISKVAAHFKANAVGASGHQSPRTGSTVLVKHLGFGCAAGSEHVDPNDSQEAENFAQEAVAPIEEHEIDNDGNKLWRLIVFIEHARKHNDIVDLLIVGVFVAVIWISH